MKRSTSQVPTSGRKKTSDHYYKPFPNEPFSKYPIDWTHEREWRARVKERWCGQWGPMPKEGVPLVLPPDYIDGMLVMSLPQVLVQTLPEAAELYEWIAGLPQYEGTNGFIRQLYDHFAEVKILPLDVVSERLEAGDTRWARLETLPWDQYLRQL